MLNRWTPLIVLLLALGACAVETSEDPQALPVRLGPADGLALPAVDTGRVQIGASAPDFSLETFRGDTLTLSEFRGRREVILVFYRGSW
jgi:hypothetical protein